MLKEEDVCKWKEKEIHVTYIVFFLYLLCKNVIYLVVYVKPWKYNQKKNWETIEVDKKIVKSFWIIKISNYCSFLDENLYVAIVTPTSYILSFVYENIYVITILPQPK